MKRSISIDSIVWAIVILFPILSFFVMAWHSQFTFQEIFVDTSRTVWQSFFEKFYIGQIGDRLNGLFTTMGWNVPRFANAYVSYIIFCYFLRLFYSVLMFLPRWVISVFEKHNQRS